MIRHATIFLMLLACVSPRAGGLLVTITDPGQGVIDFTGAAAELSGLAWLAGATYHAASDEAGRRKVYELNIALDPANGRVLAAAVTGSLVLAAGHDLEGIALSRPRGEWWIADEGQYPAGGFLRAHALPDGKVLRTANVPADLLEYGLGGDPLVASAVPTPQGGRESGRLSLSFTRNIERTDLILVVQAADDPASPWSDLALSMHGGAMTALDPGVSVMESGTGLTRVVTVRDSAPSGRPAPQRRFMRVKVTQ